MQIIMLYRKNFYDFIDISFKAVFCLLKFNVQTVLPYKTNTWDFYSCFKRILSGNKVKREKS